MPQDIAEIKAIVVYHRDTAQTIRIASKQEAVDVLLGLIGTPFCATSNGCELSIYVVETAGSNPIVTGSNPENTGSKPVPTGSKPVPTGPVLPGSVIRFPGITRKRHHLDTDYLRGLWREGGAL